MHAADEKQDYDITQMLGCVLDYVYLSFYHMSAFYEFQKLVFTCSETPGLRELCVFVLG